jgi:hypothetical protein
MIIVSKEKMNLSVTQSGKRMKFLYSYFCMSICINQNISEIKKIALELFIRNQVYQFNLVFYVHFLINI